MSTSSSNADAEYRRAKSRLFRACASGISAPPGGGEAHRG